MIIDTDVLIWFLRGNEKAKQSIIESLPFSISCVTYMELLQGIRDKKELSQLKKAIEGLSVNIIQITPAISQKATEYIEQYSLGHSMELADALIASTCVIYNEVLFTANEKHYKCVSGLNVKIFKI